MAWKEIVLLLDEVTSTAALHDKDGGRTIIVIGTQKTGLVTTESTIRLIFC